MTTPAAPAAPAAPAVPAAPVAPVAPAAPVVAPAAPVAPAPVAVPAVPAVPAPVAPATPAAPATPPAPTTPSAADIAALPAWAQQLVNGTQQPATPPAPVAPPVVPVTPADDMSRLPQWAQRVVTDGQGAARTLATQSAIIAAAPVAGADIVRLLDSQAAMNAVSAVDPTDAAAITAAITAVMQTHPHLAAAPVPPARGGVEFGAPPSGDVTPAQFAAMDYGARVALHQSDPELYRRLAG